MTTEEKVAALFKELRKPLPPLPKVKGTLALVKALGDRPFVIAVDNSGSMPHNGGPLAALTALSLRLNRCPEAILEVGRDTKVLMTEIDDPADIAGAFDKLGGLDTCNLRSLSEHVKDNYPANTIIVFITDGQEDFSIEFQNDLYLFMINPDVPAPLPFNPYTMWLKRVFAAEKLNL